MPERKSNRKKKNDLPLPLSKVEEGVKDVNEGVSKIIGLNGDYVENYAESLIEADGKSHIKVDLRHGNPVFEPYSSRKDLAHGIFDYVEDVAKYTKITSKLAIDFIITPDYVPLEGTIQTEYYGNYAFEFDEKKREHRKSLFHSYWMLAIGIFFLSLYIGLSASSKNIQAQGNDVPAWIDITSEVISIVSWVFVWDSTDKFFFERPSLRKESLRKAQLAEAEVHFLVLKENEKEKA
jgi:hypothetical protein